MTPNRYTDGLHLCEDPLCTKKSASQFCPDHTPLAPKACPTCGCQNMDHLCTSGRISHLGTLGTVTWFRCSNCHTEFAPAL